jgi:uncharacterized phiE125 gp8 family phage protein
MIQDALVTLATSPVTLDEAKRHARVTVTDEDSDIEGMISAATDMCQRMTSRQFLNATRVDTFEGFPSKELELGRWPLSSVTSIVYVDADGDDQTWTASLYQSDTTAEPPTIKPAYNQSWPTTRSGIYEAVTVTYVAGYGNFREAYAERDVKAVEGTLCMLLGVDRVRTF